MEIPRALLILHLGLRPLWLVGFSLFLLSTETSQAAANCSVSGLRQRNCLLQTKAYKVQIRGKKVLINNGTWRAIEDLSLNIEKSDWQVVRLKSLSGRQILELMVWVEPKTEAKIQTLVWLVYELENFELHRRLQKNIGKRRPMSSGNYLYDPKEKFYLTADKSGKISWTIGQRSGSF